MDGEVLLDYVHVLKFYLGGSLRKRVDYSRIILSLEWTIEDLIGLTQEKRRVRNVIPSLLLKL